MAERLREAEASRFPRPQHQPGRSVRIALGYRLVEIGLRLAVRQPAVSR